MNTFTGDKQTIEHWHHNAVLSHFSLLSVLQGHTSEWEDAINSEVTSSDTSACTSSDSDFSDDKSGNENPFSSNSHLQHVSYITHRKDAHEQL